MKKKYQVFVSSTYNDLIEERREVMQALLELDCIPTGMELFQASNLDQWNWIKQVIDDCDYYIVIVAGKYGTIHPKYNISYTEMEYKYALEKGKPIIGFLHRDISLLPVKKAETNPDIIAKLNSFSNLVSRKLIKYWDNTHELSSVISRSIIHMINTVPSVGWIRANVIDGTLVSNANTSTENSIIDDGFIDNRETTSNDEFASCSFCDKHKKSVKWLIAKYVKDSESNKQDIYICDECVDLCAEIIKEYTEKREMNNS